MRFKTSFTRDPKHKDIVTCVAWTSPDDVFSTGDDHQLLRWNLVTNESNKVADLPADLFPTSLKMLPRSQQGKRGSELFLLTGAEGKFYLLTSNGRIEKHVDAHQGAILSGCWSHDGAGILTAGEDGFVKIWSRAGMLRSTLAQSPIPVYSAVWSPDSEAVLYTSGKYLVIKPLQPNSKATQFLAHEGLVLKVDWSPAHGLILTAAEDCRYRLWDPYGRMMFNSSQQGYPITAIAWSPDGGAFAVGSFNTLRLCDRAGWSYSLEKPNVGSLLDLAWSQDGTQVAAACGLGHVLFAHVIEKRLEWKNYEATVTSRKAIALRNVTNDTWEKLEFRDRIIKLSLNYGHLVVITSSQCYIYSTRNWNTPIIVDLREGTISLLLQAHRHFLMASPTGLSIYSYEGKQTASPKWGGMKPELINDHRASLSNDLLAVVDQTDSRGVMVQSIAWNDSFPMLAALQNSRLIVWLYPAAVFSDIELLTRTALERGEGEFGKNPILVSFTGNMITCRRSDGSMLTTSISPHPTILHGYALANKWNDATRLCRLVKDDALWSCLAAMSLAARELNTAEIAYAAVEMADKVEYLQYIKGLPSKDLRSAEMYLLARNTAEAERILLQNGLIFRAIMMHLFSYRWDQALDLAVKHKTHVDTVLAARKRYCEKFDVEERNPKFQKAMQAMAKEGVREQAKEGVREQAKEGLRERAKEGVTERAKEGVRERAKEKVREQAKEGVRERAKEGVRERAKEEVREQAKEEVRERAKEGVREQAKEVVREQAKEEVREQAKEGVRERAKEGVRERAKEGVREQAKEGVRERAKEGEGEQAKEWVREQAKEGLRERAKEGVREQAKEGVRERAKEGVREQAKEGVRERAKEGEGEQAKEGERASEGKDVEEILNLKWEHIQAKIAAEYAKEREPK
ncbi:unnamed protein product [Cyprideis torosa]|uniref:Uncharacterized protein n=1 Tax=Cyprideis torosa TaxID=163714 RepID=A0A7R8WEL9_9CRUS|nr:unnamed protein product [Cyprideis torosa]CAG0895960.1 unnamed protein product [Cyprideis torosa]